LADYLTIPRCPAIGVAGVVVFCNQDSEQLAPLLIQSSSLLLSSKISPQVSRPQRSMFLCQRMVLVGSGYISFYAPEKSKEKTIFPTSIP